MRTSPWRAAVARIRSPVEMRTAASVVAAVLIATLGVAVAFHNGASSPTGARVEPEGVVVLDAARSHRAERARWDRVALAHAVRQSRETLLAAATTAASATAAVEVAAGETAAVQAASADAAAASAGEAAAAWDALAGAMTGLDTAMSHLGARVTAAVAADGGDPAADVPEDAASAPEVLRAGAETESARLAVEAAHHGWAASMDAWRAAEETRAAEEARAAEESRAAPRPSSSPAPEPGPAAPSAGGGRPTDAQGSILWVTSVPTADGDGSNGQMPMSAMCRIPWGADQLGYAQYLRCDAGAALTRLNDAFRAAFGEGIAMDLTYRSYEDQVAMKEAFGALAARPGTSSHGLGTALDVQEWPDVYGFGTARYEWLVANGPSYGWTAPARVRQDGAYPEYWHFEYLP
ncbi:M15 family metallopeptidase [Cellulomonas chengniuliangii]|uniref:M15 family metallopeptidase n=1 Tax=Cellulomonas chengniuliangii TaxID=2968084 RepID=UPI001D0E0B09|nr:M15 family metallopeptidase [Cellulomonas chengniuliangii]MCC2316980.1 M15 family metallopeptidase [Cellulomonas chengniuliangii]